MVTPIAGYIKRHDNEKNRKIKNRIYYRNGLKSKKKDKEN